MSEEFRSALIAHAQAAVDRAVRAQSEAATQQYLVLPFLQLLGYNPLDPDEVIPEAHASFSDKFKNRVDYRRYNGAALLGLKGLVFKSHGGADAFSFGQALIRAHDAARNRLLDGVHDAIVDTMQALPPTGGESVPQAA